ncbi:EboA domain-containing protein [Undibacterium umbellatum]|uniref:EboA domain-containing protein n=1 Tax=Undibacterium umbellatum TaxID=2762300 RepID=A0ABR6Z8N1_9BURK|nr:EboA domain-containing protein [Undibacterium umbellatum]MBC3907666.1 EboA domain-containing protein [Undibacterium umbellatum]
MRHPSLEEMQALTPTATALSQLDIWIAARSTPEALLWFRLQCQQISTAKQERDVYRAMGMAARKLGKLDLNLSSDELATANSLRPGFDPSGWSVDIAARVAFILASYAGDEAQFASQLDSIADSAEINELIALYSGFPLYPAASVIEHRAREAIRSSMRPIFEAMAHRNPYPMQAFDEAAWNQMVVKCFFLDSSLWPVQGLEQRNNPALARILIDLAHERWAAGRAICPELWRCVTPQLDAVGEAELLRVLEQGSMAERLAIAKSLPAHDSKIRNLCQQQNLKTAAKDMSWQELLQESQQVPH